MCDCPGRQFGAHYYECRERDGRYRYEIKRTGTNWLQVILVLSWFPILMLVSRCAG